MLAQATSKITPVAVFVCVCVCECACVRESKGECKSGPATVQLSALLFSPILWWRVSVKSDWKWLCRGDQAIASAVCARRYAISAAHLSSPFQWLPSCPQISRPMRPESQSAHAARWQPRDSGSACLASPLPHPESFSVSLYPLPPPSWLPLFRVTVMNGHARLMAVCGWLEQPPFFLITDPVAVISCIISFTTTVSTITAIVSHNSNYLRGVRAPWCREQPLRSESATPETCEWQTQTAGKR